MYGLVSTHISCSAQLCTDFKKRPISSSGIGILRLNVDLFEEVSKFFVELLYCTVLYESPGREWDQNAKDCLVGVTIERRIKPPSIGFFRPHVTGR